MKFFPRLLLRCPFEIVEVGNEVTAVSVGGEGNAYNGIIQLKNESARFMFEKVQQGITLPELIKACMEEFDNSPVEEVGPKVIEFLDMLKENGLLAADTKHGIKIED
ncbi:MAG: PqqD family protein [Eubacteriales bacterium]|nr:PqqD family protein [Eubacteriales bacterium]